MPDSAEPDLIIKPTLKQFRVSIVVKKLITSILMLSFFVCRFLLAQENRKHRAIILTDIEADPDGTQSMIRLLLYSNVIDIEGWIERTRAS
jgi:hypothetical protein